MHHVHAGWPGATKDTLQAANFFAKAMTVSGVGNGPLTLAGWQAGARGLARRCLRALPAVATGLSSDIFPADVSCRPAGRPAAPQKSARKHSERH